MVAKIPFTATWVVPGDASDTPASGVVTITPTAEVRDANGAVILTMIGREYELDETGSISGSLYATDDATVPSGWTYTVKETFVKPGTNIAPAYQRSWNLIVPKNTVGTLDLSTVADAQPVPLMADYATWIDLQNVETIANAASATATSAASTASSAATVAGNALAKAQNLNDLPSKSTARTNLGLGGAATLAVGTTAGTVAAGDDARFSTGGGGKLIDPAASLAVRGGLLRGIRSLCIALIGDSTGDNLDQPNGNAPMDDFFNVLGKAIGTANPGWSVWNRQWNVTNEIYDPPTSFQQGTLNGGGDRYVDFSGGGTLQYLATANPINADMTVDLRVMPNTGWAPGGGAATRVMVCNYDTNNKRGWLFALNETGNLVLTVGVTAGTSDAFTAVSTAAVPFSNGTPGWVRVQFDADNGASGSDTKFYTSTDGTTWTQLGSTVTNAGAIVQYNTQLLYYMGSMSATPANKFNGRVYWVDIKQNLVGASQPHQVPPLADWWDQATTPGNTILWGGAPVLLLLNGSASGQNITYFNNATRTNKLNSPHSQLMLILNDGHNEANPTQYAWRTALDAWLTSVRTKVSCPIIFMTQNPSLVGTQRVDQQTADFNTVRGIIGMSLVSKYNGMYPLDTWPAFTNLSTDLSVDHLHPSQAGATKWGNYLYNQLFA